MEDLLVDIFADLLDVQIAQSLACPQLPDLLGGDLHHLRGAHSQDPRGLQ